MSRLRIGLDLDGVCYDFDGSFRDIIKYEHGLDLAEATEWNAYEKALNLAGLPEAFDEAFDDPHKLFGRSRFTYGGVWEATERLAELGDLVVTTSRKPNAGPATFRWLGLECLPVNEVRLNTKNKSVAGCDIYIDDGPHIVEELLANTQALVLLWDRPWNRDFDPFDVVGPQQASYRFQRVHSWDDVLAVIDPDKFRIRHDPLQCGSCRAMRFYAMGAPSVGRS